MKSSKLINYLFVRKTNNDPFFQSAIRDFLLVSGFRVHSFIHFQNVYFLFKRSTNSDIFQLFFKKKLSAQTWKISLSPSCSRIFHLVRPTMLWSHMSHGCLICFLVLWPVFPLQQSWRKLPTRVMTIVKMQLFFLLQYFDHWREVLGYWQWLSQIGSNWQDIATKLVKTFLHKLIWNHGQVKDKWEKFKKKYIVKKKEVRIIGSTPSKWC